MITATPEQIPQIVAEAQTAAEAAAYGVIDKVMMPNQVGK